MFIFSYPKYVLYILGAQKNGLTETVLLSTHNIDLVEKIRKLVFTI